MATQEQRTQVSNLLVIIGLLIMLVMALIPLLNVNLMWMRWAYAAGAAIVLVARVVGVYNGPVLRIKRLHRLLILSAILYCGSAATMFYSPGTNDWIAFLLAGLVMQIYASWMIDYENKKQQE
jgi:hypothetical protein